MGKGIDILDLPPQQHLRSLFSNSDTSLILNRLPFRGNEDVLLAPEERRQAVILSQALFQAQVEVRAGERDAIKLRTAIETQIQSTPLAKVDYVGVCDPDTLESLATISGRAVAVAAVSFGETRLIDNVLLEP